MKEQNGRPVCTEGADGAVSRTITDEMVEKMMDEVIEENIEAFGELAK